MFWGVILICLENRTKYINIQSEQNKTIWQYYVLWLAEKEICEDRYV
jgi:hypothetical protein